MKSLTEIKRLLESHKKEMQKEFGVKEIGIFGSVVRAKQKATSDLDILIELERPVGLFEFVALKHYLTDLLDVKVDLVMKKALRPRIGERILKEVIYV